MAALRRRRAAVGCAVANGVSFVRLADELADRHDVVIMNHYLEHTREPFDELDTAARVVLPGGYPLTEVHPALGAARSVWQRDHIVWLGDGMGRLIRRFALVEMPLSQ